MCPRRAIAEVGYTVISSWHTPPGVSPDGTLDAEHLRAWVTEARRLLADSGRSTVGEIVIGGVLAYVPPDSDGLWPAEPVRDLIEDLASQHLETGVIRDSGRDAAGWAKLKQAAGFVKTGIRYRCSDWADAAWRPVDAVLRSRTLSNLFVLLPTGVGAYVVLLHEGTIGVLTSFESIFVCGAMLYGVIKAGRWYRDVEPPEPKARRAEKDGGT